MISRGTVLIGSTLKIKTEEQIFYTDFKNFDIDGMIGVSQISTVSSNNIIIMQINIDLINIIQK